MPKKILITEDSPTVAAIIKSSLTDAGYSVIVAEDGKTALDLVKKEKPDLIVMDLMLPKLDGYKVCAMLKFDRNFANIPIIILTARSADADKAMGEEVHADAYITKPFEPQVLLLKIKELLEKE
ncbi:MAG: response regulator [Candidatus Omnitrophica bacterium]|nr:response regulator [Candidatus Omnitrophota bacterium]